MAVREYKKTITVDRSKWCRGGRFTDNADDTEDTALLTAIKTMCCLGFFCLQMGVPKKDLLQVGTPESVPDKYHDKITALVDVEEDVSTNSSFADNAIEINDNSRIDEKTRERELKQLFAENDYRIVFVGCTPKE